ncbi:MAG: Dps family protein [Methylococcales bacterium]
MLADQLKIVQADAFTFYLKAHFYHWNIEGPNFPQYHEFLNDLYNDVWESVDTCAELIRTLNVYAPGTLSRFKALTTIEESESIPDAMTMMKNLLEENNMLRASLLKAYSMADKDGEVGIANFLQDRIQQHENHGWMLQSITK